ncbi:hypothetical protein J5N97_026059 [Dioscorea zingiberensis]|uniref:Uncharacterized protein n=1 Tax=Dioscorea zingiberensis TaxID=325984 RepID=A0A9D5H6D3_9LILI|nr:hypothetical protein J5N97_026059 [Dioscorea zingiberensis]
MPREEALPADCNHSHRGVDLQLQPPLFARRGLISPVIGSRLPSPLAPYFREENLVDLRRKELRICKDASLGAIN